MTCTSWRLRLSISAIRNSTRSRRAEGKGAWYFRYAHGNAKWIAGSARVSSVQFSRSVVYDSLRPHDLSHTRPSCTSPTPGVHSISCPSSLWCHPAISSSVVPFSSCLQSFPASGSVPMNQFYVSGGQSIGVLASASVLPMTIQDWSPLGLTGWISLQSMGLSRVFSSNTVQKHQFFQWIFKVDFL